MFFRANPCQPHQLSDPCRSQKQAPIPAPPTHNPFVFRRDRAKSIVSRIIDPNPFISTIIAPLGGEGGPAQISPNATCKHPTRMRLATLTAALALATITPVVAANAQQSITPQTYIGFDANDYPGDALLPALRQQFAFTGYWLNNPPGATHNPWVGKRSVLVSNGFGFLIVFNGRLDTQILRAKKLGKSPAALGKQDAGVAVAAANRENFPTGAIIFLDQEEGGRLLPEQAEYLLSWTETVASSDYRPGVYASGQPVPDEDENGKKIMITTIEDIRARVAAGKLHEIAFWDFQGACPPAPGCVVDPAKVPAPDLSGTLDLAAWQYALSPRDPPAITKACAATYNRDLKCYAPGVPKVEVDLNSSTSPDPSHGR